MMPKAQKKKKGPKWYGVRRGRQPGIYETWPEAEKQVVGFPGALHASFRTYDEAKAFVGTWLSNAAPNSVFGTDAVKPDITPISLTPDQPIPTAIVNPQGTQPAAASHEPPLSPEQERILGRILAGENFFFTGSAGTGKSVLLRAIIRSFKERHNAEKLQRQRRMAEMLGDLMRLKEDDWEDERDVERWKLGVTASTGMAAVNVGGCTLHAWAGIGLGKYPVQKLYESIMRNDVTVRRWRSTGALIVDEISMIDGGLFDKLEELARRIRRDDRPFGGLQVILSGDFYQLPPVPDREGPPTKFAFDADSWTAVIKRENMHALTRVFRQKEDQFVGILERMRRGVVKSDDADVLRMCQRTVRYDDGIEPVALYPSKIEVNRINEQRLKAINAPLKEFLAHDQPGVNSRGWQLTPTEATVCLDRNTIWPQVLSVKVGAMVMLVTNMQDDTLVNGSTGVIVDFMTLPQAAQKGNVYLPSRAAFGSPNPAVEWPIVEFIPPKHAGVKRDVSRVLIPQMCVDVMNANGTEEASRYQVPLIVAFSLTIHKAQGQSIERLKVDLGKIFERGQTYVALSRATSMETLEVLNFSTAKVMVHPRVIEWARPFEEEQADDEEWDNLLADEMLEL